MASTPRDRARERFGSRCGYCGVNEADVGATLTIDHHHPRSRGGSNDDDNLVYACPRCNEHKGRYWHHDDPPHTRLLHPGRDELALHVRGDDNGRLVGLTSFGTFFVQKLRLNRAPLVAHRLALLSAARHAKDLETARQRVRELEQRISSMRAAVEATTDEIEEHSSKKRL